MVQTLSPSRAMILAAGLGTRMRPLTETCPKPLLCVKEKPLLACCLDRLKAIGVKEVVINTHYLAEQVERFLTSYPQEGMVIHLVHELILLETGGGVQNALSYFHDEAFYVINADNFWQPQPQDPLLCLAEAWRDDAMDALLALVPLPEAHCYTGQGDFIMHVDGQLTRYYPSLGQRDKIWVFSGLQILHSRLFHGVDSGTFSLNKLYNKALAQKRLYGCSFGGQWWHIGAPEALQVVNHIDES